MDSLVISLDFETLGHLADEVALKVEHPFARLLGREEFLERVLDGGAHAA